MGTFNERPRLLLSAFVMNTTNHILGGQWRHPMERAENVARDLLAGQDGAFGALGED